MCDIRSAPPHLRKHPAAPDRGGMPHRSFRAEVTDAVTPRATLLILGVIALRLLFIAPYVGALPAGAWAP